LPWEWLIVLISGLIIGGGAYLLLQSTEEDDEPAPERSAPPARRSSAIDPARARASLRELDGITQVGGILGTEREGVPTLQVFAVVTSRGFARFDRATLPELLQRYVEPGRLRIQLRTLPGDTTLGQRAARWTQAAGLQTRLWDYARVLAAFGGHARSVGDLRAAAARVPGLARAPLAADGEGDRVARAIARAERMADEAGVTTTPAFTVTDGVRSEHVTAPRRPKDLAPALDAALDRLERSGAGGGG
jgi:hypothetical protein